MCIYDVIETKFKNKKDLLEIINNSNFFLKYIEIINPISYKFIPKLSKNKKVIWPLKAEYEDCPEFSDSFFKLPKMLIKQKWILDSELLECELEIFMKGFNIASIKLDFFLEMKKIVILKLKADWIHKNFLVSNSVLYDVVKDTKKIVNRIFEN